MQNYEATIAAISTAVSNAGIGIVRMSGPEAFAIADRVFVFERKENSCVIIKGQIDIVQNPLENTCKENTMQYGRDIYGEQLNQVRKEIYDLLTT